MHCSFPPPLRPGDAIAIVSPASVVDPARVYGARDALERAGFNAVIYPHAIGSSGTYSAPLDDRLADVTAALADPQIKAILCSRGGYGCVQLLEGLSRVEFPPKWLIGYSDVTALHAFMASRGIVSIHGSMAKILAGYPLDFAPTRQLLDYLDGRHPAVEFATGDGSQTGHATGQLLGGNLALIQSLIGTPFEAFPHGTILFVEDISEPIYRVERIMWQLRLAGVLDRLGALVFGRFTNYKPDANFADMEQMLRAFFFTGTQALRPAYPVVFGAPIGHFDGNMPLLHGAEVSIEVSDKITRITFL